ncbi:MAG: flagellar motor control protein ZomB [Mycobacterium sp.]|uniref:flagellar motor control protein ZomB n=1 Tax=Mycobacterium sp. TaxID=1785 RepID=UPI00260D99BF|nr:flagellar motor control protein ZomB [Mycobacterium sp.]MDI3313162.1 flagellar motor control protein ZomB [Mycobacterium sp.]
MAYELPARVSLWAGVAAVAVLFGWGAWQRRWIADDGLIVLRTVRNLLAGNGPVFNEGERVEANTSTVWTFLLYAGGWVGGPMRLEYVALALALLLSVLGVVLVMLGAARLYAPGLRGRRAMLLPAGALVYVAIPPARDFATSGLEGGLVMAYLGVLWWMMVCWSQAPRTGAESRAFVAGLAFLAGLSVLIRPELALIGGLALIMLLAVADGWRRRALIVVSGGLLPVTYEVFRMGYYGLLVPGTALAKDAAGDKWTQGMIYLSNFNQPYALWVPAVLLSALGVLLLARARRSGDRGNGSRHGRRLARVLHNPAAVVVFIEVSGLLQALYWIRQGGDFMHGRVLLTPVFCLLAPVAVIPLVFPEAKKTRESDYWLTGIASALWLAVAGWSLWAANSPGMGDDATRVTYSGIVDERRFYAQATGHAHPLTAADYLDYPRMRAILVTLNNTPAGALLLPSGNYTQWDVVPAVVASPPRPGTPAGRNSTGKGPHTVFFTNIGMVGMNVGLDVRVIDQIGLANPLAAHTGRLQHARIGHDKNLFPDWAIAEGPFVGVPPYLDPAWVEQARAALRCPATAAVLNSVRAPLTPRRFVSNLLHSYQFTTYRIDRVPRYELIRCGLEFPEPGATRYTGLAATGP